MSKFNKVSKTLFVPMMGRIYSSENYPNILYDKTALKLKPKLPNINKKQSEYTFMASAVRSMNIDRYVKDYLKRNTNGIIIELGCGLETTYNRCYDGKTKWYELDLPEVIEYRMELLPQHENQTLIKGSILEDDWLENFDLNIPVLFIAGGLFHYFSHDEVIKSFKILQNFKNAELVFDTLNKWGIRGIKRYMKELGHDEATMYFYVDNGEKLAKKIGATLLREEKYYKHTNKKGMQFMTKSSMIISDLLNMVKMIHLKL